MKIEELLSGRPWTGTLPELIATASGMLGELGLSDEPPLSPRLVRSYQSVGSLGRTSTFQGTKGVYGQRQLLELLCLRVLGEENWTHGKIAEYATSSDEGVLRGLLERRLSSVGRGAPTPKGAGPAASPAGEAALSLIAGFRKDMEPSEDRPRVAGPGEKTRAHGPRIGHRTTEYRLSPWLRISVDEEAMAGCDRGALARAKAEGIALLEEVCRR